MTCPKCGSTLEGAARFCGSCGSVVDAPAAAAPSVPKAAVRQYERTVFQGGGQPTAPKPTGPAKVSVPEALMQTMAAPSSARPAVAAPARPVATPPPAAPVVEGAPAVALAGGDFVGKLLNNRYLIKERVGEGGFGTVYRGEQMQMGRECALKVLHPRMARDAQVVGRFKREAQAVSGLRNGHTVQIYDFDQTPEGIFYLAMELLHGRSLHSEMHQGPISVPRVLRIIDGIVDSLGEAHTQGIVHRDVKPENIFLETRGTEGDYVKVLDFGIAKIMSGGGDGGAQKQPALTAAGQTLGTLEYMSPEQLMGLQLDGRSDLYAVGVLAYELLTGHLPFPSKNSGELITHHLRTVPPPPSKSDPQLAIPSLLDAVVLRLLEKDRVRRYRDAAELQADLRRIEALLASGGQAAAMAPVAAPPPVVQAATVLDYQRPPTAPAKGGLTPGMIVLLVGITVAVVGLLIAGVLLLRTSSAAEGSAPARLIPSSMGVLFGGDVAALRANVPRDQVKQLDEVLRPKLALMGADPAALGQVAVGVDLSNGDARKPPVVLVVDGKFDPKRLDRWMVREMAAGKSFTAATHQGTKYQKTDSNEYALLPGDRLVATDHSPIGPVIDLAKSDDATRLVDGAAADLLGRVGASGGRGAVAYGWMKLSESSRRDIGARGAPEAGMVKEGAAALTVAQAGADAKLAALTGSDGEATQVSDAVRRYVAAARKDATVALLGFDPLLAAVKVSTDGPYARIALHLTKPQFDDLVVRLAGFIATAAAQEALDQPAPPEATRKKKPTRPAKK